jgi:hypothetical protein
MQSISKILEGGMSNKIMDEYKPRGSYTFKELAS